MLSEPKLWLFLTQLAQLESEELDAGIRFLATYLKKQWPEAKSLLRLLGDRGRGSFDRAAFLRAVRSVHGCDEATA